MAPVSVIWRRPSRSMMASASPPSVRHLEHLLGEFAGDGLVADAHQHAAQLRRAHPACGNVEVLFVDQAASSPITQLAANLASTGASATSCS